LCAQLERREQILGRRREIFWLYRELLCEVPGVGFQPVAPWATLSPWLFCITVENEEFGCSRDELMQQLAQAGIDTRPFFIPLHRLPPYEKASLERGEDLPITDELSKRGINLPTYPGMTNAQVLAVCSAIKQAQNRRSHPTPGAPAKPGEGNRNQARQPISAASHAE
jgi:perosamine synthetase